MVDIVSGWLAVEEGVMLNMGVLTDRPFTGGTNTVHARGTAVPDVRPARIKVWVVCPTTAEALGGLHDRE